MSDAGRGGSGGKRWSTTQGAEVLLEGCSDVEEDDGGGGGDLGGGGSRLFGSSTAGNECEI